MSLPCGCEEAARLLRRERASKLRRAISRSASWLACWMPPVRSISRLAVLLCVCATLVACGNDAAESQPATRPMTCSYPPAPYGLAVGEVLGSHLAWEGFAAYTSAVSNVAIVDFHDCDGVNNVNAVLFVTVTVACGECVVHLEKLEARMASWESIGIRVVVLVADSAQGLASVVDAENWKSTASLDALAVVADPNFSLVLGTDVGYPNLVVVDPRTMTVIDRQLGFDDDQSALEELAAQNAGSQ